MRAHDAVDSMGRAHEDSPSSLRKNSTKMDYERGGKIEGNSILSPGRGRNLKGNELRGGNLKFNLDQGVKN